MKMEDFKKSKKYKDKLKKFYTAGHSPASRKKAVATLRKTMAAKKRARLNGEIPTKESINEAKHAAEASRVLGRIEGYIEGYAEARGLSGRALAEWVAQGLQKKR